MGNDGARDRIEHGPMALWATKAQLEAHARLIWENLTVNLGANKKQWLSPHGCRLRCGPRGQGAVDHRADVRQKWGVMTRWGRGGLAKWNVRVMVNGVAGGERARALCEAHV